MRKITITFLCALFSILNANAQWQDDTAVNTLAVNLAADDIESVGTSTGKTYIAFWKTVPAPTNFELRVQLLDENGVQQFGPEGILVSNTIPMGTYTASYKVTVDSSDNLYIGVTGTGSGTPGYVFKITPQGTSVWPNGINLGTGYSTTVLPMSNGDIIVSYWPGTKGLMQRYTAAGTAVWTAPVEIVPPAAYSTRATIAANLYELSNGNFTVVFHVKFNGVSSLIHAQSYNANGVAQWAAPAALADKYSAYNNPLYGGALDGDVLYYGYSLSSGTRYDSYVQRLNTDGTTPWGINGIDFDTNTTTSELDTEIAFQQGSQYVWAISRYAANGAGGTYVQKFDKNTGARQFTDNAKEVFPVDDNFRVGASDLRLVNDQPLFIAKSGFDNGATPVTLNAVLLDANGNTLYENGMLPVATYAASKGNISLNMPVNNMGVVVFTESKADGEKKVYAQNFTIIEETCTVTPDAIADHASECPVNMADLTVPVATDSCGNEVTPTTDATFPITQGTTVITWTYTTVSEETATQTQNIIVNDVTAPQLQLQNITVEINDESTVAVTAAQFDNGSTDACGTITAWSVSPENFNCDSLGEQTVTITATDSNGNTATGNATVTVTDPNNHCTAGTDDFGTNNAIVYPNPAKDMFTVNAPSLIRSVTVHDISGKIIAQVKGQDSEISMNTAEWANGIYIVTVETADNKIQKMKLLKM